MVFFLQRGSPGSSASERWLAALAADYTKAHVVAHEKSLAGAGAVSDFGAAESISLNLAVYSGLGQCVAVTPRLFVERVLPLVVLGTACCSVPVLIASDSGLPRLERLRHERRAVDEKVSRLSDDIRRLRAEVERIKSDPSHTERVARDELGLVRQTEIVFQFEP